MDLSSQDRYISGTVTACSSYDISKQLKSNMIEASPIVTPVCAVLSMRGNVKPIMYRHAPSSSRPAV
jgi:hypothetical protein